jgi:hypothetical protein
LLPELRDRHLLPDAPRIDGATEIARSKAPLNLEQFTKKARDFSPIGQILSGWWQELLISAAIESHH